MSLSVSSNMAAYFLERFLGFGAGFVGARRSTLRIRRSNASGLGSVSSSFAASMKRLLRLDCGSSGFVLGMAPSVI
jgi:hypothetical protein